MIRFRTLGSLDLRSSDGRELRSVLAQPKRVALLAYLAVARPGGFHRRDTLVALFWPELDTDRARASLRKAIHLLRRALGRDAIIGRGDDELALDPERVWCDAAAFAVGLAKGSSEEAVELYDGPFLDGLFVPGAPEFERWLEETRAHLRDQAARGAAHVAEDKERTGDLFAASLWARRAFALTPADEQALRRLLRLLDRVGDRAGALEAYEGFARELESEYSAEPAPETQRLLQEIRQRGPGADLAREPQPPAAPAPEMAAAAQEGALSRGAPSPADPDPTALGFVRPPRRALPRLALLRQRVLRGTLAAALVALLAMAAVGAWASQHVRSPVSDGVTTILVLPFTHGGDPDLEFLGAGAATILSSNLFAPGLLTSVDPWATSAYLDGRKVDLRSADAAREAAAHFQARWVVVGEIASVGERLRVDAALLDMSRGGKRIASVPLQGPVDDAFDLLDELSRRLLASVPGVPDDALVRTATRSTSSVAALKAYLQGERLYREGRFAEAIEHYRTAMGEDTTFALAHYRFSVAADWAGGAVHGQGQALSRALRHTGDLAEPERLLIEAWDAYRNLQPTRAEAAYKRLLVDQPHNVEAWYRLGETQYHYAPFLGRSYRLAGEAFERARHYRPDDAAALTHLARIAAAQGDGDRFAGLVAELERLGADEATLADAELLRACAFGDQADRGAAIEAAVRHGPQALVRTIRLVLAHTDDLRTAARLAAEHEARVPGRTPDEVATQALIELARGRPSAVLGGAGGRTGHPWIELRGLALALPGLSGDREALTAVRRDLARLRAQERPGQGAPRRIFLEGILAVRAGDASGAEEIVSVLRAAAGYPPPFDLNARYYARIVQAALLGSLGRPSAALDTLGQPPVGAVTPSAFAYPHAFARFLRALLLEQAARPEEALEWLATFPDANGSDVAFRAPAHRERARIYAALGRFDQAAAEEAAAAALWRDAEPGVRSTLRPPWSPLELGDGAADRDPVPPPPHLAGRQ